MLISPDRLRRADVKIQARKAAEHALWFMRTGGSVAYLEDVGVPRDIAKRIKASVAGGTTQGDMAALAELRQQNEALVSTYGNVGYFDNVRADAIEGEFFAQYAAAIADPIAGQVIEGKGIRVTSLTFDSKTLYKQATGAIIVLTKELLRFASAIGVIEVLMRRAIARSTDAIFIPQLTNGAPTVAASGADSAAVLYDLRRALVAIPSGADARFRVGVGPRRLAVLSVRGAGRRCGRHGWHRDRRCCWRDRDRSERRRRRRNGHGAEWGEQQRLVAVNRRGLRAAIGVEK
jgi:hypothetical protein